MSEKNEVLEYLDKLPAAERTVLAGIRKQILTLVPGIDERLSRGVPFFYYLDKRAVGFRFSKNHLSFFIMEGNVLNELRAQIAGYDNGSTVVRFSPEHPLPEALVKKLLLARIAEIEKLSPKSKRSK